MPEFEIELDNEEEFGRLGTLDVPHGPVNTPALFPVVNIIGGTTPKSGAAWRHFRDNLLDKDHVQGVMFQAMSFLDYGVTANTLGRWRDETFREKLGDDFVDIKCPIFIDSGGFSLMNSDTFGDPPSEGGKENEWGLYTNPDSILKLQADFGGDIVATLDYPIPPELREAEKTERMQRSIESAVRCLQLIENPEQIETRNEGDQASIERLRNRKTEGTDPGVFVAIHGHDYETISWYVQNFLDRIQEEGITHRFNGFAIGSLVPLRSRTNLLVDIVQGAKDAIPAHLEDEIALHIFGVGGKQVSLLTLLGADSFDCSTHMQTARYKKYVVPGTWEHISLDNMEEFLDDGEFPCELEHCTLRNHPEWDPKSVRERLNMEPTYGAGPTKTEPYGLLARHNFEVYNDEMRRVREKIRDGELLEYIIQFARDHEQIKQGLKYAQIRDRKLQQQLRERGAYDLIVGPDIETDQAKLTEFGGGVDDQTHQQRVSLQHTPNSFNILNHRYTPPAGKNILLLIPCSKRKPYAESRTHRVVIKRLQERRDNIHKVTISGMYGPVPEEHETDKEVMEYEYVLSEQDTEQIELVRDRLISYLQEHGESYDLVIGYAASSTYRGVIQDALNAYGQGELFPKEPEALRLTEHFRKENIKELMEYLDISTEDMSL
ncbi:tRNA-guanine family transglycosylase [Halorubrum alkaliphilum]|uniref:tRNA-guanine family transglycosylase n=1 Tax=Halorubrum alkaliphilum TaxID=261290 RepID=A0A8T4GHN9_9EURY|nr:tRNA-guanine transglycosylase [Halorubrum alkaliphilum]MBP1923259.1 tRNA-guanine family transglycosylase [Halorubrum alkaliphilum]